MADRRPPGFNVDLDFADSKEVLSIPRRWRCQAVGLWALCGTWSAKKLQDGYVPPEILERYGATPAVVKWLFASTLWTPANDGGVFFTRWEKWQRTRLEVVAYRQGEASRKKRERAEAKKATSSDDAETSARTTAGRSQSVRPDDRDPSTSTKTTDGDLGGDVTVVNAGATEPPPQTCSRHPNGTDRPCGACANARRKYDDWNNARSLIDIAGRRDRLDAIANCPECDDGGWIPADAGDTVVRCEHTAARVNHA